ncbi:MAG: class I SAM-dependent methyltransferase [Nitrospirae bacterium]|nr:class I SAM-dependent methyltransferase [Nitrospirota bacterium]
MTYDRAYYAARGQSGGRVAFWFYYRLAASYVRHGCVLDYGCGGGRLLRHFNTKDYETYGYDPSQDALDMAKENTVSGHLLGDRDGLPADNFDLVCAIHVLEHIEQPLETLQFIRTLLKPRGVLLYVVPNISGIGHTLKKNNWIGYGDPAHVSLLPQEKWIGLTEKAGFKLLRTGTDGLWDVPYIEGIPLFMQRMIFYPAPAVQVMAGRLILPCRWGESLIAIAQRSI